MKEQLGRLASSTLTYGIGQVLTRFISFLLLPLFTSYLTPADYGVMAILGLLSYVALPIFSFSFGTAIGLCYFDSGRQDQKATTIWTSFAILIASTCFLGMLAVVFGHQLSFLILHTPDYARLCSISLLTVCFSILAVPFMTYLQLEGRARTYVIVTTLSSIVTISATFATVVVMKQGLRGLLEAGLLGQIITLLLFFLPAALRLNIRFDWALGKKLLRLGLPLVPSFAFVFILLQGNRYALQWFAGLDAVGIYSIGFNFGMVINLAVGGFTSAWTPYFLSFAERRDEASRLFGRIFTYYTYIFGVLSLLFFIFAKPLVVLMTQAAFHDAYKVIGLSAGAQFLVGAFSLLLPGMYFAKEVRYVNVVQASAAIVAIGFNLLLIPSFGLFGAALALLLGALAMVLFQHFWNLSRKQHYLIVHYERGRLLRFAFVYLIYVVVSLWKRNFTLPVEFTFSILSAMVLAVVIYLLLTASERHSLRSLILMLVPSRTRLRTLASEVKH